MEEGDIVVGSAVKTVGYLLGWDVGESVHPEYGIRNGTNNSRIPNMSKSKQAIRFHSEIVERNVQVSISIKFIMPFDRNKTKYEISFLHFQTVNTIIISPFPIVKTQTRPLPPSFSPGRRSIRGERGRSHVKMSCNC